MVLATRTSAPNTSLAVIRPKPRPDSPTASEISVIMLKSELPHEASNPVSKKTPRVHHASRWHGSLLVARGESPARAPAVVGVLRPSAKDAEPFVEPFRRYMKAIGWEEGRNIRFLFAWMEGHNERAPLLASDFVAQNVDGRHGGQHRPGG